MTDNHLLLYRLAELMLEKEQHILPVDSLFEDEQIGGFVRSINIDSPYQQLLLQGVFTETLKNNQVMVSFTVEGYFHYVLGEVIAKQSEGKDPEYLKSIIENNQLKGAQEGVEQCLVRDIEKNDLSRLMWLIDEGGKSLEASSYPLAQAFLIHPIKRVLDDLLADPTENDIKALEKAISELEIAQLNDKVKSLYQHIYNVIRPNSIFKANLYVRGIEHIPKEQRTKALNKLTSLEFKDNKEIASDFYSYLAKQFNFIAEYDKAIEYYEKALAIKLKVHGNQHPSTGTAYNNLGLVWNNKGEYDKAIEYYTQSLAIKLKVYGNQHPSTGTSYNNLGVAWSEKGEYDKAIEYYEKALAIKLKVHGDQHPSTGTAYNNLGSVWKNKGEYDKAIEYFEKALAICLKVYGNQHPSTGTSYNNLGVAWSEKGEYDKAIEYYEKALAIKLKIHGDRHPDTGISYYNLGQAWEHKGEHYKAIEYFEKALAIYLKVHGDQHPSTGAAYNNLGNCYRDKKQYSIAIKYYQKSYDIFLSKLGEEHQHTKLLAKKLEELNDR